MKPTPELSSLRNLLFIFDIDYTDNDEREEIIVSKNVNNRDELSELFDQVLQPEFTAHPKSARDRLIRTFEFYLEKDENFDSAFDKLSTYFNDEIEDHRDFMKVLLERLTKYENNIPSQQQAK
ncbi:hypothetical protein [Pseudomonas sp. P9_31]|uniref:hypothetical protein n=1 Tax=Pseudomonas sp. P9_31 TaxID=3043448 RepID=UPI002A3721C5|nr:hypothetical protein [Pseudomonas sp. P9_31]WPN60067.1 hypothetical protein QMK51_10875 [Pseudomonas sp. P9_31]